MGAPLPVSGTVEPVEGVGQVLESEAASAAAADAAPPSASRALARLAGASPVESPPRRATARRPPEGAPSRRRPAAVSTGRRGATTQFLRLGPGRPRPPAAASASNAMACSGLLPSALRCAPTPPTEPSSSPASRSGLVAARPGPASTSSFRAASSELSRRSLASAASSPSGLRLGRALPVRFGRGLGQRRQLLFPTLGAMQPQPRRPLDHLLGGDGRHPGPEGVVLLDHLSDGDQGGVGQLLEVQEWASGPPAG